MAMKEVKQKRVWYGIIIALIFSVVFVLTRGVLVSTILSAHSHSAGFVDGRPAEKLTASLDSPDGLHTMEVYDNGGKGATVSYSSTVIISANPGGDQWKNKKRWCIYFSYPYDQVTAEWLGNDTVVIRNPYASEKATELSIYRDEYFVGR